MLTSPLPVKLDACPYLLRKGHLPPAAWQQSVSTVDLVELVDELAQAYETSLRLQHILRPLVPKTTWYQATDAAWQWKGS